MDDDYEEDYDDEAEEPIEDYNEMIIDPRDEDEGDLPGEEIPTSIQEPLKFLMPDSRNIPVYVPNDTLDQVNIARIKVVPDDERCTMNRLTQYELAQALSVMATIISKTGQTFGIKEKYTEARDYAYACVYGRKCPLILEREIRPNVVERFRINEMILPISNA